MQKKEFSLLDEPWIKVLTMGHETVEVSLKDLFANAHHYACLAGETPTQDAALIRFLLATAETVFYRYEVDGEENLLCEENGSDRDDVLDRWRDYYDKGAFEENVFSSYLEKYRDRFYLFHPETPFYQVADLQYGTDFSAVNLYGNIKESNNPATKHHFSMNEGNNLKSISLPEAARWLIHYNAYAVNVKKNNKAPGSGNPVGTGRMGRLGFIMADGENLFDTIMINLCALRDGEMLWGKPKPAWEQPVCSLQAREIAIPDNIPEAYTIQSRRLLLKRENDKICGIRALGGDYYPMENEVSEQMTLWKAKYDKKSNTKTEVPKTHDPSIHIWREFSTIICEDLKDTQKPRIPGLVKWLQVIMKNRQRLITFHTIGMKYDGMSYGFVESVNDSLMMSSGLLLELGNIWRARIENEILNCRAAADLLAQLSDDISFIISGKDSKKRQSNSNNLTSYYYSSIDHEFRNWLLSIDVNSQQYESKVIEWQNISKKIALQIAENFVLLFSSEMFRTVNNSKTIPESLNEFIMKLNSIYAVKKA